jgi:TolB-like protein/Flp pilus assembly protein TadD
MTELQAPDIQATSGRDVFISYASQDKAVADVVCEALESAGVACWIAPRNVTPGEFYAESIVHAIDSTKVIVLILSQNAADSQHVLSEVERARSRRHPIVSLRIDLAQLPAALEYFLNTSQWLDASATGVDRAMPKLIAAVKNAVAQPSARARDNASPPETLKLSHRRSRLLAALAIIVAAACAYFVLDKVWLSKYAAAARTATAAASATPIGGKSIAVLPFVDMSEQHDQQYFGDGLAEEILNVLGTIPGLKVIGRSSSFQFRGDTQDLRKVGETLGARYIVEGSVRKSGKQLKVTAQLVDATDGTTRWSDTYVPSPADTLSLQRKIATAVARALRLTVLDYFSGGGTRSEEAHDLYLRGLRDVDSEDPEALQRAVTESTRAVEIDSTYVEGWVGLANAYDNVATTDRAPRAESYRLALQAIDKALALDPRNADAYSMRAFIRMNGYDWSGAEQDVRKSLQLHRSVNGIEAAAKLAIARGSLAEADDLLQEVLAMDPLDIFALDMQVYPLYPAMGRFKEADRIVDKLRDINGWVIGTNADRALNALWQGDHERALRLAKAEGDATMKLSLLVIIYTAIGNKELSKQTFQQYLRDPPDSDYYLANMYAVVGDHDRAFQHLDRAYEQRAPALLFIKVDPLLAKVRDDPRYTALLRKMRLPE